jgi:hypothetical protein
MSGLHFERRGDAHRKQGNVRYKVRAEDHVACRASAIADLLVVIVGIRLAMRPEELGRGIGCRFDAAAFGAVGIAVPVGACIRHEKMIPRRQDADTVIDRKPAGALIGRIAAVQYIGG